MELSLQGKTLNALLDTGSCDNFVKESVAQALSLKIIPSKWSITLASTNHRTAIKGYCSVSLTLGDNRYDDVILLVLANLCCDILLGHNFMRLHKQVSNKFNKKTHLKAYPLPRVDDLVQKVATYLDLKSAFHQIPIQEEEKPFTAFDASDEEDRNLEKFKQAAQAIYITLNEDKCSYRQSDSFYATIPVY